MSFSSLPKAKECQPKIELGHWVFVCIELMILSPATHFLSPVAHFLSPAAPLLKISLPVHSRHVGRRGFGGSGSGLLWLCSGYNSGRWPIQGNPSSSRRCRRRFYNRRLSSRWWRCRSEDTLDVCFAHVGINKNLTSRLATSSFIGFFRVGPEMTLVAFA